MCGIVGYVGRKEATPLLIEGLRRLEYRGYDSAGICVLTNGTLHVRKQVGRVEGLAQSLKTKPVKGSLGISHTRWATHGLPSDINSHPHLDQSGKVALVHNGIIENYTTLRHRLQRLGHRFLSQTDTEVLAHLIGHHLDQALARKGEVTPERVTQAIFAATREVEGTYAIALMHQGLPGHLFGARRGSPLVVGLGQDENFLASDVSPIVAHTRKVVYLHDGDIVTLTNKDFALQARGKAIQRPISSVDWSAEEAERGKHPHYMLKEIFEQPGRVAEVLRRTLRPAKGNVEFEEMALKPKELAKINRLILVGCGTSWHAALVGEYVIETLARLPVEVEYGSEMGYRGRRIEKNTLSVSISQSGETADTLAAIRAAKAQGARTLGIVNVVGSTIARESDADIYMRAGPEIGVASTKAFEMQVLQLTLLGIALARQRGELSPAAGRKLVRELQTNAGKIEKILAGDAHLRKISKKYHPQPSFTWPQFHFPVALEGALNSRKFPTSTPRVILQRR